MRQTESSPQATRDDYDDQRPLIFGAIKSTPSEREPLQAQIVMLALSQGRKEERKKKGPHPGLGRSEVRREIERRRVAGASGQFQTVDSLLLW